MLDEALRALGGEVDEHVSDLAERVRALGTIELHGAGCRARDGP